MLLLKLDPKSHLLSYFCDIPRHETENRDRNYNFSVIPAFVYFQLFNSNFLKQLNIINQNEI